MKLPKLLNTLLIITTSSFVFQLSSCSTANVSCVKVQKFQSNAGFLNLPMFPTGAILMLDTLKKVGTTIRTIQMTEDDLVSTTPIDTFQILTETGFAISLEGKITKASNQVQTDAKNRVTNETTFLLRNSFRKTVKDPLSKLGTNQSSLIQSLKDNPNNILMMVSAVMYADSFDFRIKKSSEFDGQTNVMKVGSLKLKVNYNCQGALNIKAKQGGVFFKGTFFSLKAGDRLAIANPKVNLTEYDIQLGLN